MRLEFWIKLFGKGVRAESKLHQRLRFRQPCGGKLKIVLKALHGRPRRVIPEPVRFLVQVTARGQGLLNFRRSFGVHFQGGQARARSSPARTSPFAGGLLGAAFGRNPAP